MIFRALASMFKVKAPLPPPDPNCRSYSVGDVCYLLRNHERSKQLSQQFHQPKRPQ